MHSSKSSDGENINWEPDEDATPVQKLCQEREDVEAVAAGRELNILP